MSLSMSVSLLLGCTSNRPPLATAEHVDLARFMGDWYVIANIPTSIERGAHNAVESYRLDRDGTIATTFTFRADAFDGELKRYCPRGFVRDTKSNAVWGMRFIWPLKSDYRIVHVSDDYEHTVIGREKRDYVWIMSRAPLLDDPSYEALRDIVAREGYDLAKLERVPQRWPESVESSPRHDLEDCS